jgi:hypothetical protein
VSLYNSFSQYNASGLNYTYFTSEQIMGSNFTQSYRQSKKALANKRHGKIKGKGFFRENIGLVIGVAGAVVITCCIINGALYLYYKDKPKPIENEIEVKNAMNNWKAKA